MINNSQVKPLADGGLKAVEIRSKNCGVQELPPFSSSTPYCVWYGFTCAEILALVYYKIRWECYFVLLLV